MEDAEAVQGLTHPNRWLFACNHLWKRRGALTAAVKTNWVERLVVLTETSLFWFDTGGGIVPKAELLDPQGKVVAGALNRLGIDGFAGVRIGKRFELTVEGEVDDALLESAQRIADEILSNSVIEDVVGIEVIE